MVRNFVILIGLCFYASQAQAQTMPQGFPSWAYVMNTVGALPVIPDDGTHFKVPGSVAKGMALARAPGGNASFDCKVCHGADYRGIGFIPSIAGRSPSYVTRQLWEFQSGARNGAGAQAMKLVVAPLSSQDMLALSAYLATLAP